jgi:hypothetical protein
VSGWPVTASHTRAVLSKLVDELEPAGGAGPMYRAMIDHAGTRRPMAKFGDRSRFQPADFGHTTG